MCGCLLGLLSISSWEGSVLQSNISTGPCLPKEADTGMSCALSPCAVGQWLGLCIPVKTTWDTHAGICTSCRSCGMCIYLPGSLSPSSEKALSHRAPAQLGPALPGELRSASCMPSPAEAAGWASACQWRPCRRLVQESGSCTRCTSCRVQYNAGQSSSPENLCLCPAQGSCPKTPWAWA